jgi:hypothetical protein
MAHIALQRTGQKVCKVAEVFIRVTAWLTAKPDAARRVQDNLCLMTVLPS